MARAIGGDGSDERQFVDAADTPGASAL
jgi:hypothetical protein